MGRLPRPDRSIQAGGVRVYSSNGIDVTAKRRELTAIGQGLHGDQAVLDGEMLAMDDDGRPRFELLQAGEVPVTYVVFDLLELHGQDVIGLAYEDRRRLLGPVRRTRPALAALALAGRRRRRAAGGQPGPGPGGRDGQAARQPLPAGPALTGVAQDQEPPSPGAGDRRLDGRHRQPGQHVRRAAGRLLRGRRAALRRAASAPASRCARWPSSRPACAP